MNSRLMFSCTSAGGSALIALCECGIDILQWRLQGITVKATAARRGQQLQVWETLPQTENCMFAGKAHVDLAGKTFHAPLMRATNVWMLPDAGASHLVTQTGQLAHTGRRIPAAAARGNCPPLWNRQPAAAPAPPAAGTVNGPSSPDI